MSCYPFAQKECEKYTDRRRKISVEEKKKQYILNNPQGDEVCLIKVDDCLIKEGTKCDYLVLNCDQKIAYFIELKGCDFLKAVEQINRSIDLLSKQISEYKINVRIVISKIHAPDLKSNQYKKLEKKISNYKEIL